MSRAPSRADGLLVGRVVDTAGRPVGGAVVALSRRATVERFSSAIRMPGPPQQDRVLTRADGFFVFRDLPLSSFTLTAAKPGYSEGAFGRRRPGGPAQELHADRGGTAAGDCPAVVEARRHHRRRHRRGRRAADWRRDSVLRASGGQRRAAVRVGCARHDRRPRHLSIAEPAARRVPGRRLEPADRGSAVACRRVPRSRNVAPDRCPRGAVPMPGNASALQLGESGRSVSRRTVQRPRLQTTSASGCIHRCSIQLADVARRPRRWHCAPARTGTASTCNCVRFERCGSRASSAGPADMLAHAPRCDWCQRSSELLDAGEPVTSTDAKGAFVFPAVPAGEYSLRTTARSRLANRFGRRSFTGPTCQSPVHHEDLDGVNVTLRPGAALSGKLVFDGVHAATAAAAVQQARIVIERREHRPPGGDAAIFRGASTTSDSSPPRARRGVLFRPRPRFAGRLDVHAGGVQRPRPLRISGRGATTISPGLRSEFTDRWTGLRGIVTTPTGQTDPAALVLLFPTDSSRWRTYAPGARRMRSARVADNGEFSFASVPVGDYYLAAVDDEDGSATGRTRLLDAQSRAAMRVTINDGDQKNDHAAQEGQPEVIVLVMLLRRALAFGGRTRGAGPQGSAKAARLPARAASSGKVVSARS